MAALCTCLPLSSPRAAPLETVRLAGLHVPSACSCVAWLHLAAPQATSIIHHSHSRLLSVPALQEARGEPGAQVEVPLGLGHRPAMEALVRGEPSLC